MNKDYIASEYRRMHKENRFTGASLERHVPEILSLIKKHDIKTMLDYGCGKAPVYPKLNLIDLDLTLYDPYYDPFSRLPSGTFDMVVCTDVLEHVPEDEIGKTLVRLLDYTDKLLFISICTKPAKKTFENGKNLHLTIKSREWWEKMISTAKDILVVRHYT